MQLYVALDAQHVSREYISTLEYHMKLHSLGKIHQQIIKCNKRWNEEEVLAIFWFIYGTISLCENIYRRRMLRRKLLYFNYFMSS